MMPGGLLVVKAAAVVAAAHAHHLGPVQSVHATSYSPCSSSGSHTADGTPIYGRHRLRSWGAVAVPRPGHFHHLALGTLIRLRHPLHGRRYFRAHDYIGAYSELDFFDRNCGRAKHFTPRSMSYRVVR
jgi:hypothetical protein